MRKGVKATFKETSLIAVLCFCLIIIPDASAIKPVWVNSPYSLNDGSADNGAFSEAVIIRVTDCAANTTGGLDTVIVRVTSSADPAGIDLTLVETVTDPCVFENTNLALMDGNDVFSMTDTATITVFDDTGSGPTIGSILIVSDSDSAVGLEPVFTETSTGSNLYTAKINFGASTNPATNTLEASPGDIISVIDTDGGNIANGIISPNPSGTKGAISAEVGQTVIASYEGDSESFTVANYPSPGRGSGGLLAPGLVVDAIISITLSGYGGCADCIPPTLGLDERNRRLVEGGFSYNGNTVDVELFYTEYPLVVVNVGQENTAVLKIYENSGLQNIEHVELAFGLRKDQILAESKASISLDVGSEEIKITRVDPQNVLQDVRVKTDTGRCSSQISGECMIITIYHTFRAPLDFNMVATNVWDVYKNSWQNYFNDGIQVAGESLNPPPIYVGIDNGRLVHIVKTNQRTAVDAEGNAWTFDKIWTKDYVLPVKSPTVSSHGYERYNIGFQAYKQEQEVLALQTLEKILFGKKIINDLPKESKTIAFNLVTRDNDDVLKLAMLSEERRAQEHLEKSGFRFSQYVEVEID